MAERGRFPVEIMATAVVPWTADWQFDEPCFRREIEGLLAAGYRHIYTFGTAGEGYAVDDAQFLAITRVFADAVRAGGVEPMVGLISLSLPTIVGRIEAARDLGVRRFQISLPSWGALETDEVAHFFEAVVGRFADCQFLHYNLARTKRLIAPQEYGALAATYPNLVATKNSTDSMARVRDLLEQAADLRHFFGETGYAYGSQIGACGLLISIASTNPATARAFFDAGRARDAATVWRMEGELRQIGRALVAAVGAGNFIDGAYDKVLWKLHDPAFPLRLLPPYQAAPDVAADTLAAYLREHLPHWAPPARRTAG
jgi:dihydrodipicolinate synthase/N-acetylneuraminate lyase